MVRLAVDTIDAAQRGSIRAYRRRDYTSKMQIRRQCVNPGYMNAFLRCRTLAAFLSAFLCGMPAAAAGADVTGMSALRYLVGDWTCKAQGSDHPNGVVITFKPAVEDTLHEHVQAEQWEFDAYFGYSSTLKQYYMVYAQSGGFYAYTTSLDGHQFSGTARAGPARKMNETMTFSSLSAHEISIYQKDVQDNNPVSGEVICRQ